MLQSVNAASKKAFYKFCRVQDVIMQQTKIDDYVCTLQELRNVQQFELKLSNKHKSELFVLTYGVYRTTKPVLEFTGTVDLSSRPHSIHSHIWTRGSARADSVRGLLNALCPQHDTGGFSLGARVAKGYGDSLITDTVLNVVAHSLEDNDGLLELPCLYRIKLTTNEHKLYDQFAVVARKKNSPAPGSTEEQAHFEILCMCFKICSLQVPPGLTVSGHLQSFQFESSDSDFGDGQLHAGYMDGLKLYKLNFLIVDNKLEDFLFVKLQHKLSDQNRQVFQIITEEEPI